jgi:hypothetical protein
MRMDIHPDATETCDGEDDNCSGAADDGPGMECAQGSEATTCTSACSTVGTSACSSTCTREVCRATEACNGCDDDADSRIDEGFECSGSASRSCTTRCGSTGSQFCSSCTFGTCAAPSEICNLADDDCDGICDERVSGCRRGVHRSVRTAFPGDHFYTTNRAEASCCGYSVESYNFYYLYTSMRGSLQPFYRCLLADRTYFYTRSSTCEGSADSTRESTMGYIATSATCGSTPLYRLRRTRDGEHFYTTSASERDNAIAMFGYVSEGVAGHVWQRP